MCNNNLHVCFCPCKRVKVHVYIQRLSAYAYTYVCACKCVHLNPFVLFLHLSSFFSPSISTSCCYSPPPSSLFRQSCRMNNQVDFAPVYESRRDSEAKTQREKETEKRMNQRHWTVRRSLLRYFLPEQRATCWTWTPHHTGNRIEHPVNSVSFSFFSIFIIIIFSNLLPIRPYNIYISICMIYS